MREHTDIVDAVLNEFFEVVDGSFVNQRADKEIQAYKGKIEQASRAGKASAERRSNARSTDVQPNIKQEPLTIKQEIKNTATVVARLTAYHNLFGMILSNSVKRKRLLSATRSSRKSATKRKRLDGHLRMLWQKYAPEGGLGLMRTG